MAVIDEEDQHAIFDDIFEAHNNDFKERSNTTDQGKQAKVSMFGARDSRVMLSSP